MQSDELLTQVQLQGVVKVRTGRYSGGMRRRLSVAIALLGAFMCTCHPACDVVSRSVLHSIAIMCLCNQS